MGSHETYFYISESLPDRNPCVLSGPREQEPHWVKVTGKADLVHDIEKTLTLVTGVQMEISYSRSNAGNVAGGEVAVCPRSGTQNSGIGSMSCVSSIPEKLSWCHLSFLSLS